MVISGYSMDLYCDCKTCEASRLPVRLRNENTGFVQLAGSNLRDCLRQAKKRGWRFADNNTVCYAPWHIK